VRNAVEQLVLRALDFYKFLRKVCGGSAVGGIGVSGRGVWVGGSTVVGPPTFRPHLLWSGRDGGVGSASG